MERIKAEHERRGKTLSTDSETRMKQPPLQGRGYEDWGSDFQGPKRAVYSSKKPQRQSRDSLHAEDSFAEDESDDELDLISSQPRRGPQGPSASSSKQERSLLSREPKTVVSFFVDGQQYDPHPDYQEDGKSRLQGLKFKKNKKKDDDDSAASSSTTKAVSSSSAIPTKFTARPATQAKASSLRNDSLHKPFRPPTRIADKANPPGKKSPSHTKTKPSTITIIDEDQEKTPRPIKVQPKPRPIKKGKAAQPPSDDDTPSVLWGVTAEEERKEKTKPKAAWPMDDLSPLKGFARTGTTGQECPFDPLSPLKESSNARSNVRPFPLDLPSPAKGENNVTHTKDKKKYISSTNPETSKERPLASRATQSFPVPSPLSSPAKPLSSSTPGSTRTSQDSRARKLEKGKGKARSSGRPVVYSSESEAESINSHSQTRPFPMGTQMLESIQNSSAKRGSSDTEETNHYLERRQKKRARGVDEILRELMYSDGITDEDDDDLLFNDPNLDPARLCPWCDELLPPAPSPHLEHLVSAARARSTQDSRPTNPLGLYAAPTVFINVCQRHRFESHQIPLAQQRGWPTQIAWDKLAGRVRRLKRHLRGIVEDVDESFFPGRERQRESEDEDANMDAEDDESLLVERPRRGSAFWKDVVRSVRQKGARKTAGVRGQMTTFAKTQPGYYGELGSVVISQTIYDLFPPVDFPPNSTLPLTPTEFIQRILVPEAALRLIMEDMHQTRGQAIKTLRESAQYGVAMFPDDHSEEGCSASEEIIKARAVARRKQLQKEEEEEEDAELWNAFPDEDFGDIGTGELGREPIAGPSRPRRACAARAQSIIDDSDSDISMASSKASTTSRSKNPRAKSAGKAKKISRKGRTDKVSDAQRAESVEILSGTEAPPKRVPRPRAKARDPNATPSDTDVNIRTSDADVDCSDAPPPSQEIRFRARGKTRKVSNDDKGPQVVDFQLTPKARKVGRIPSGSSSNFAMHITKTRSSSEASGAGIWARTLRAQTVSSDNESDS